MNVRLSLQVRLDAMGFNVSAPHMHATCLEALDLQPGHSFLDIGSGCGLVTAAAAFLVSTQCEASLVQQACMRQQVGIQAAQRARSVTAPGRAAGSMTLCFTSGWTHIGWLTASCDTVLHLTRTCVVSLTRRRGHGWVRWASRAARWASTSSALRWCWRGAAWQR